MVRNRVSYEGGVGQDKREGHPRVLRVVMRPERITPSDPSDTVSSGSCGVSGSDGGVGRFSRLPALQIQLEASHLRSGSARPDLQAPSVE